MRPDTALLERQVGAFGLAARAVDEGWRQVAPVSLAAARRLPALRDLAPSFQRFADAFNFRFVFSSVAAPLPITALPGAGRAPAGASALSLGAGAEGVTFIFPTGTAGPAPASARGGLLSVLVQEAFFRLLLQTVLGLDPWTVDALFLGAHLFTDAVTAARAARGQAGWTRAFIQALGTRLSVQAAGTALLHSAFSADGGGLGGWLLASAAHLALNRLLPPDFRLSLLPPDEDETTQVSVPETARRILAQDLALWPGDEASLQSDAAWLKKAWERGVHTLPRDDKRLWSYHAVLWRRVVLSWLQEDRWEFLPSFLQAVRRQAEGPVLGGRELSLMEKAVLRMPLPAGVGGDVLAFAEGLAAAHIAAGGMPLELGNVLGTRKLLVMAAQQPLTAARMSDLEDGKALAMTAWLSWNWDSATPETFSRFQHRLLMRRDGHLMLAPSAEALVQDAIRRSGLGRPGAAVDERAFLAVHGSAGVPPSMWEGFPAPFEDRYRPQEQPAPAGAYWSFTAQDQESGDIHVVVTLAPLSPGEAGLRLLSDYADVRNAHRFRGAGVIRWDARTWAYAVSRKAVAQDIPFTVDLSGLHKLVAFALAAGGLWEALQPARGPESLASLGAVAAGLAVVKAFGARAPEERLSTPPVSGPRASPAHILRQAARAVVALENEEAMPGAEEALRAAIEAGIATPNMRLRHVLLTGSRAARKRAQRELEKIHDLIHARPYSEGVLPVDPTLWADTDKEAWDKRVDKIDYLGHGGINKVTLAFDLAHESRQMVVRETIKPDLRALFWRRYLLHAHLLERSLAEGDGEPGVPYLWGAFYDKDGRQETLEELLDPWRSPSSGREMRQTARALLKILARDFHGRGVVHADLKPGNIGQRGDAPVLMDLDLALFHREQDSTGGHIWGTPFYMPARFLTTGRFEPSDDLHALGVSLYEHAANRANPKGDNVPFTGMLPAKGESSADHLLRLHSVVLKSPYRDIRLYRPDFSADDADFLRRLIDPTARRLGPASFALAWLDLLEEREALHAQESRAAMPAAETPRPALPTAASRVNRPVPFVLDVVAAPMIAVMNVDPWAPIAAARLAAGEIAGGPDSSASRKGGGDGSGTRDGLVALLRDAAVAVRRLEARSEDIWDVTPLTEESYPAEARALRAVVEAGVAYPRMRLYHQALTGTEESRGRALRELARIAGFVSSRPWDAALLPVDPSLWTDDDRAAWAKRYRPLVNDLDDSDDVDTASLWRDQKMEMDVVARTSKAPTLLARFWHRYLARAAELEDKLARGEEIGGDTPLLLGAFSRRDVPEVVLEEPPQMRKTPVPGMAFSAAAPRLRSVFSALALPVLGLAVSHLLAAVGADPSSSLLVHLPFAAFSAWRQAALRFPGARGPTRLAPTAFILLTESLLPAAVLGAVSDSAAASSPWSLLPVLTAAASAARSVMAPPPLPRRDGLPPVAAWIRGEAQDLLNTVKNPDHDADALARDADQLRQAWEAGQRRDLLDVPGPRARRLLVWRLVARAWMRDGRWDLLLTFLRAAPRTPGMSSLLLAADLNLLKRALLHPDLWGRLSPEEEDPAAWAVPLLDLAKAGDWGLVTEHAAAARVRRAVLAAFKSPTSIGSVEALPGGDGLALAVWLSEPPSAQRPAAFSVFHRRLVLTDQGGFGFKNPSRSTIPAVPHAFQVRRSAWDGAARVLDRRYRLPEKPLSQTYFSTVFRASDLAKEGKPVIVKTARLAGTKFSLIEEIRLHQTRMIGEKEHTPAVLAAGQYERDGETWAYMVMEDAGDNTLTRLISDIAHGRRPPLSGREAMSLAVAVYDAVAWLNEEKGLLHRDIKPANIIVHLKPGTPARAQLLDFGVAAPLEGREEVNDGSATVGAPPYVHRQVLLHGRSSRRTDAAAVALVLYAVLAPYRHPSDPSSELSLRDLLKKIREEGKDPEEAWPGLTASEAAMLSSAVERGKVSDILYILAALRDLAPWDIRGLADVPEPLARVIMDGARGDLDEMDYPSAREAADYLRAELAKMPDDDPLAGSGVRQTVVRVTPVALAPVLGAIGPPKGTILTLLLVAGAAGAKLESFFSLDGGAALGMVSGLWGGALMGAAVATGLAGWVLRRFRPGTAALDEAVAGTPSQRLEDIFRLSPAPAPGLVSLKSDWRREEALRRGADLLFGAPAGDRAVFNGTRLLAGDPAERAQLAGVLNALAGRQGLREIAVMVSDPSLVPDPAAVERLLPAAAGKLKIFWAARDPGLASPAAHRGVPKLSARGARAALDGARLSLYSPAEDVERDDDVDLIPLDRLLNFWEELKRAAYIASFA
jgi:serine/threonine protein kinase